MSSITMPSPINNMQELKEFMGFVKEKQEKSERELSDEQHTISRQINDATRDELVRELAHTGLNVKMAAKFNSIRNTAIRELGKGLLESDLYRLTDSIRAS